MKSHGFPRNSIYVSGGFSSCQCWCTWAIYSLVQKNVEFLQLCSFSWHFLSPKKRLPIAATVPEKCRNDRPFPCPVSGRSSSVSALNSSPAGTLPKSPKTLISSGWKTCNVGFLGISGVFVMDELIFFLLCFPFKSWISDCHVAMIPNHGIIVQPPGESGTSFAGNMAMFSRLHRDDTNFVSCCTLW